MTRKFTAALFLTLFCSFFPLFAQTPVDVSHIDIVRDHYGVPHIFAPTDEEVAYGLAWANSEDDFKTIQELLLAVRGRLGEVNGKDGAILDFMYHLCAIDPLVEARFDTSFSDKFVKILNNYAQALNDYAAAYPKEVLNKKLFPVDAKDLVKSYTFTMVFLTNVYTEIQKVFNGNITNYEGNLPEGSNAFAFNQSITKNGHTYLAVNSHQPLEGLFSWYEAHVCSEEGWNMLGGTFPGGACIFLGTNPYLGWANTLNHPDLCDIYKLQMDPKNKLSYKYDDKWLQLEKRPKKVKVKVGFLKLPVKKTFYMSKYGPTIETKNGFYALRFPANMEIRAPEQLYRMNKATNYDEFMDAMKMQYQAGVNTIYADRKGNIYFLSNGLMPYRNPQYDWRQVLPGNTSETYWEPKYHPLEELPQVLNPPSGYLFNTNNSPFNCTAPEDNPDGADYDGTFGYSWSDDNRSIRAQQLIQSFDSIGWDDFLTIKYDNKFNSLIYTYACENLLTFKELDPEKYPDIAPAIAAARDWDYTTDVDNKEIAVLLFAMYHIIDKIQSRGTIWECNRFSEAEYVEALREAQAHMLKYFGAVRVPLGDVQKLVRGDVALPIGGGPDVIAATATAPWKDGMRKDMVGDSYIMLLDYSADSMRIETVFCYGASAKPDSPHYTDQMQMFVNHERKPMTLDKTQIYQNAEKIYHPAFGQPKSEGIGTVKNN